MVLSGLLEIYVTESVKESECGLSCCLVLPAARKRRGRKTGQVCLARKAYVEEGERMLPRLFIVARGSGSGRMAWNILIGRKYEFGTKTVKIFLRQTIIWNSFCFTGMPTENSLFYFGKHLAFVLFCFVFVFVGVVHRVRSGAFIQWMILLDTFHFSQ